MAASSLNISKTFVNEAKLKTRNNYLSPCRVIVQMSDSYGNPKVSKLTLNDSKQHLTAPFQENDCSATFSSTSISGNISSVSAVGCDPLGRTDSGSSLNTLDGESGPVLKHCQSIQLNSQFTEEDMQLGGRSILQYQSCDLGVHEFVFNVNRSGTYVFVSTMTINSVSINLRLNVDVDSGMTATTHLSIIRLHIYFWQEFQAGSDLLFSVITCSN